MQMRMCGVVGLMWCGVLLALPSPGPPPSPSPLPAPPMLRLAVSASALHLLAAVAKCLHRSSYSLHTRARQYSVHTPASAPPGPEQQKQGLTHMLPQRYTSNCGLAGRVCQDLDPAHRAESMANYAALVDLDLDPATALPRGQQQASRRGLPPHPGGGAASTAMAWRETVAVAAVRGGRFPACVKS